MQSDYELGLLRNAPLGEVVHLPGAGTPLEHPRVFDSAARVLSALAEAGILEVVSQREDHWDGQSLITEFAFRRLR